ncbi:MAG: YebC/PmpR family DNA-binding transcriptional regulator [Candidatus Sungbacteria bacterium]|nr:YebC/PmpR family DNA-binding transcriptional regulator [Candidatus Sungbacteria bacterium]
MAGHSHWKQVKHQKGTADAKRGKLFSKLVKEITVAAREGGVNPDANVRLRSAMERARSEGLPKDNMERALARAAGRAEDSELFEFLYEASASGGIAILIEGITDNKNRSLNEIKHILTETGARLAEQGSLIWNFEKIGILTVEKQEAYLPDRQAGDTKKSRDAIELAIIEAGARDFGEEDDVWIVETNFGEREAVRERLAAAGIAVRESGHDYKARHPVEITPDMGPKIETLLDALLEQDDVQEVYTNISE